MLNAKNKILLTVNAKNKFLLAVFVLASLLLIVAWAGHPIITEAEKHHDFWLVFLTFLLVLATLVPAFAVGFQIREARLSSERQLRAYVFVEEAKIKNEPYKWEITFQIRNFGQTPAHKVSLEYAVGAVDWPDDDDATPKLPTLGKPENLGSMAPRRFCFEKVDDLEFKDATLEEITNHTKAIYLLGTITYETVFGTRFRTKFRYYVGGDIDWDGPGEMNADEEGNSAE